LPFDRSGCDLTAHVLRSLAAWRGELVSHTTNLEENQFLAELKSQIDAATETGLEFLIRQQRADGSWVPLWFGNQHQPADENPIYGTARVLAAFRDLNRVQSESAKRGVEWLARAQQADGGWGGGPGATEKGFADQASSVEETALAVEALLAWKDDASLQVAIDQGLGWLMDAVLEGRHRKSSPLGFYFAKLWYYERLYPLIHTVSALGQAVARLQPQGEPAPTTTARPGRT
jgi:squalene-hopene/tetraprenyl-beta-curcumene cyclase